MAVIAWKCSTSPRLSDAFLNISGLLGSWCHFGLARRLQVCGCMYNYAASIFLSAFTIAVLAGCGDVESATERTGPNYVVNLPSWSPDAVKIRCPSGDCPEGVGTVIFAQSTAHGNRLQRCTATLISADRVLTNSHCGKSLRYDRAFFFVLRGEQTVRYPLRSRIYDREEGAGIEAGMGPDLAIFTLADMVTGVKPRAVGRHMPRETREFTGFKINEPGRALFQNFTLEKDKCTTIPKQALFGGGAEENNIGLALFGCTIVRGNSGTPLFANGNWDEVQVVVNSSYPFQTQSGVPFLNKLDALFEQRPVYFSENFAMGNRVHCMDIDGLPSPDLLCRRATVGAEIRKSFESSAVKIYRDRLGELNTDPTVIWGLRVYDVKVRKNLADINPRPGIVMIPYPVCVRAEGVTGKLNAQQIQYMALGIDSSGIVTGRLQKTQVLKSHYSKLPEGGEYQLSFDRDFASDIFQYPGTIVTEPEDLEARRLLTQTAAQVAGCKPTDHPEVRERDVVMVQDFLD